MVTKTSVYLSEAELALLALLAEREGTSQAEIIRRAIRRYESEDRHDRQFDMAACADGPGGSVADIVEEDLLAGFGS